MVLIFISTFRVKIYIITFKNVLASLPSQEFIVRCHPFCTVTVEECHVPYIMAIEENMKVGARQGGKKRYFSVSPHVFCRVCKLEVESCSKGLQGQNKQPA